MDRVVLGTDILSEVFKKVDRTVISRADAYFTEFGRYTISAVTVIEVVRGFRRLGRVERVRQFLVEAARMEVLPVDLETAALAGRLAADLQRAGQPIGWADPLIAAVALHHGLAVVTGNLEHFRRIQALGYALKVETWRV